MKTFDTTSVSGLLGETTTCGHVTCTETATLRLNNTIKIADDYVYQIVIRSAATSNIVLKIGTQSFNLASTTSWQRLIQKFTIENNNTNYIDLIFSPGEYWFYNAKLETGIIATAWTPAPEDFDIKLYSLQSEFNQRADSIEMSVSKKQDIGVTAVRYIRDWLDGNNVDNKNYWLECMVISHDGDNLMDGATLSEKDKSLNTLTLSSNVDAYKDEVISSSTSTDNDGNTIYSYVENDHVINSQYSCIETDLGQIYNNIDYIRIWHRFTDGNYIFNHKLQVSSDGVTWVTLYDSSVSGGYEECADGKTYYLNGSSIVASLNKLSMTLDETKSQISNAEGDLSSLTQTVDEINSQVSKNYDDANSALEQIRNDLNTKIEEAKQALADFEIRADSIYATVATVDEYNNTLASQIKQSSSGWEALFAQLSMGENRDKYNVQTNIKLDVNGIIVTNPITGQTTQMTIDQFCGIYNGEKVFWIEKDTTKTRRLLCEKGWDTDYIKMTTNAYTYADGTILKGVAFVKSGGNS